MKNLFFLTSMLLLISCGDSSSLRLVDGCYKIGSPEALYEFAAVVNNRDSVGDRTPVCAELNSDIVVNESPRQNLPNVKAWTPMKNFVGTFDGRGHVIRGLYFDDESQKSVGLFASVAKSAKSEIRNLGVEDSYFNAKMNVGGIVGEADSAANLFLENVYYDGSLYEKHASLQDENLSRAKNVGGLLGVACRVSRLFITNSYSTVKDRYLVGNVVYFNFRPDTFYKGEGLVEELAFPPPVDIVNSFYCGGESLGYGGVSVTPEQFKDGTVARALREYNASAVKSDSAEDKTLFAKRIHFKKPRLVDGCYQIASADELYGFSAIVNGLVGMEKNRSACGVLIADIEINHQIKKEELMEDNDFYLMYEDKCRMLIPWIPMMDFGGTFDGQGHSILGLFVHAVSRGTGLFGSVRKGDGPVTIRNLTLKDSFIYGHNRIGAFVGFVHDSTELSITNSRNLSGVHGTPYLGGFVGYVGDFAVLKIEDSYSGGEINGEHSYGIFIGGKSDKAIVSVKNSSYADSLKNDLESDW